MVETLGLIMSVVETDAGTDDRWGVVKLAVVCWSIVTCMGCTHPLGPLVTWREVGDAVVNAATSPMVLVPAAGAVAFHIDDWDAQVAAWATDHTPLFGSPGEAEEASDQLRDASLWAFGIAAVATPTGPEGTYALANKVWEVGLGAATLESTRRLTNAFKDVSRAHLNKRSFPSAHTARAAVGSTLAVRYVDYYAVPGWARNTLKGALIALPYATGWARMEAGVHVPSDVLAGVAWGNFFGVLVNGLLDARMLSPVSVTVLPWEKGAMVRVDIRY